MESGGESQLIPLVVDMHGPRLANKNEQDCHVTRDNDDEDGFFIGIFTNMKVLRMIC